MVRLLVIISTAPAAPALMLEVFCSILSLTPVPSLIWGVIVRLVPIAWRWIVWKGLIAPCAAPVAVN